MSACVKIIIGIAESTIVLNGILFIIAVNRNGGDPSLQK